MKYSLDSELFIDEVKVKVVNYDNEFDMYLVEYPNLTRTWVDIK